MAVADPQQTAGHPIDRVALPLALASKRYAASNGAEPLDRLRMQIAVFLLVDRGFAEWRNLYDFEPLDWGPYSSRLAHDLNELTNRGLLAEDLSLNYSHKVFRTTPLAAEILSDPSFDDLQHDFIAAVRGFVTTRTYNKLLADIFAEYPEYAAASRYKPIS